MGKTERLVAAAAIAMMLAAEAGCSNDASDGMITCTTVDPTTGQTRHIRIPADQHCPPPATTSTSASSASGGSAGWYYHGGSAYYGRMPADSRPATPEEARRLEDVEEERVRDAEAADMASEESAREASRGASEGGEHGGEFGESGGHAGGGG